VGGGFLFGSIHTLSERAAIKRFPLQYIHDDVDVFATFQPQFVIQVRKLADFFEGCSSLFA
jgi:hypothetical protein